jgi:hypothetical protein
MPSQYELVAFESVDHRETSGEFVKCFDSKHYKMNIQNVGNLPLPYATEYTTPELGYLILDNPIVAGKYGWLFDTGCGSKRLVDNLSQLDCRYHPHEDIQRFKDSFVKNSYSIKKVSGITLNLCSMWAYWNYGHFVLDSIGKLGSLPEGFNLSNFDHIVVNYNKESADKNHILDKIFGESKSKILSVGDDCGIQFERLITPTICGISGSYHENLLGFYKKIDWGTNEIPIDKIYIPRNSSFRLNSNEKEVIELVKKYGYHIYDVRSDKNTIHDFRNVRNIISSHQACLSNMLFCNGKVELLEFLPELHGGSPFYQSIANLISGESKISINKCLSDVSSRCEGYRGSMEIDIEVLKKYLDDKS